MHGQPFLGIVTWILFSGTPQECRLCAPCLLVVFPLQPLLLAREEKQSQGTEEKQSKAGVRVAWPPLPVTGAEVLTWRWDLRQCWKELLLHYSHLNL